MSLHRPPMVLGRRRLAVGLLLASFSPLGMTLEAPRSWRGQGAGALRLQVGPGRALRSIGDAARLLKGRAGIVEVDAGSYPGDVAVWEDVEVTVRAVGGRVQLPASGAAAERKGIWVVRNSRLDVEGFDFNGVQVPDANGAGIRFESGHLRILDCSFTWSQNGLLTNNNAQAALEIENSVFAYNGIGQGDGQGHNLYVGAIGSLRILGSWSHHARKGHLLKSRAARNLVLYNRLSDGPDGHASYELEFPSGGLAVVMGNLIQQSATTENAHLVSFGAEGYKWSDNRLVLVHNTFVDERPSGGMPLRVRPGAQAVQALNNLLLGTKADLSAAGSGDYRNNPRLSSTDFGAGPERYRPPAASRLAAMPVSPVRIEGMTLEPTSEFAMPVGTRPRTDRPASPGALAPANP